MQQDLDSPQPPNNSTVNLLKQQGNLSNIMQLSGQRWLSQPRHAKGGVKKNSNYESRLKMHALSPGR